MVFVCISGENYDPLPTVAWAGLIHYALTARPRRSFEVGVDPVPGSFPLNPRTQFVLCDRVAGLPPTQDRDRSAGRARASSRDTTCRAQQKRRFLACKARARRREDGHRRRATRRTYSVWRPPPPLERKGGRSADGRCSCGRLLDNTGKIKGRPSTSNRDTNLSGDMPCPTNRKERPRQKILPRPL